MPGKESYLAAGAALGIAASFALPAYGEMIRGAVIVAGGLPLLVDLARKAWAREFGSDLLAGMAIITSAVLGEYLAGAIIVLMLSGGTALEEYATRRASAVLGALAKRSPQSAHREREGELVDLPLTEVAIGDELVILPHEICPADGVVVRGHGSMDEAYLTGEPYQVSKTPGATVLSGAVNGETALTIRATRRPEDSRFARIVGVLREAEQNRPAVRRLADRLGAWYTVVALALALGAWGLSGDADRFLAVLVIATPCPLLLAIPVTILGAISVAASRGIVIRNPALLEQIDRCRTFLFDKTGTLTYGRPSLTDIHCAPGVAREQALGWAASLERYSKHPLAATLLETAGREGITVRAAASIREQPGQGLAGVVDGAAIEISGRKQAAARRVELPPAEPGMECVLWREGRFAALFRFADTPRADSRAFLDHLRERHAARRLVLISGDREAEVRHLAELVGITEVHFAQSPEQKLALVRQATAEGPTLFLGDGMNDAPALQAATVGIAFGQNSDVTAESADAVVLEASLERVDELIQIGRRMRRIALESAGGGMALSMIGMGLAAAGYLPAVEGAVAQEVIDAAAVLNALRMAWPGRDLQEMSRPAPAPQTISA